MTNLEQLKLLLNITGNGEDNLLTLLLEKAEKYILNRTKRTVMPDKLASLPVDIALIDYNRRGTEGENSRSEGGISQSFSNDYPDNIISQIKPFIRVGVIGLASDTK